MSSEISGIGGGPVRSPEPDSGSDPSGLPDGTSLGDGKYVFQGKIVGIADLPDGLRIGDHLYAWQGKEAGIAELPDGTILRIGEWSKIAYRGREVDPSDLPDGQVVRGTALTWYAYHGGLVFRPPNGLQLSNGRYFYTDQPGSLYGPGRELDLGDLPDGLRLQGGALDGKYVWNGRAVDLSDLPDGTVIQREWGAGGDRYACNGEIVSLADLPDGTRLSDGTWKYTVPGSDPPAAGACGRGDLSLYFPEGTRFSDGMYLYGGTPMRFIEMLLACRLDGIEKAGREFEESYDKVKVTNDHIRVLNDIAERLGTLDPDEDRDGASLGPPIEGLDENVNTVTLTVSQWIEKLGLEDAVKRGSLDLVDLDLPGIDVTFIKWDKGMLDSFKEKIQAKIREFNNRNEEDMILLNQHNMDKQTLVQMYMSDVDKWMKSLPTVSP